MKTDFELHAIGLYRLITADYLRCRINDALMGRKTALKFWCPISYRQATNRIRKARRALRRHNSRMVWL